MSTRSFDPTVHLPRQDIAFSPSPALLHARIRQSKTNPFRVQCVIQVDRTGNAMCPVAALVGYLHAHQRRSGPLFVLSDESFLIRAHIQAVLWDTLPFARPEMIGTQFQDRRGGDHFVLLRCARRHYPSARQVV